MYANIIHTKWLLYYRAWAFFGLGQCMSYDWWAMASKLYPKAHRIFVRWLLRLLFNYSGRGTYSQATPRLINTFATGCDEFASNQLWVSRSSTSFLYLLGFEINFTVWIITILFESDKCQSNHRSITQNRIGYCSREQIMPIHFVAGTPRCNI